MTYFLHQIADHDCTTLIGSAQDGTKRIDTMILGILNNSRLRRSSFNFSWIESHQALEELLGYLATLLHVSDAHMEVSCDWPTVFVSRDELLLLTCSST